MNVSRAARRGAISKGKDAAPKSANISAVTPLTDPRMRKAGACASGGGCPRCQTKLAVSEPGDSLERGADRIANAVMQLTPFVAAALSSLAAGPALIQRQAQDEPSGSSVAADEDLGDAMPDETDAQPLAGNAACPVNAGCSHRTSRAAERRRAVRSLTGDRAPRDLRSTLCAA